MLTSFKITMGDNFAIMAVLAIFLHVTRSHAQANPGGFISIDCGSAVPQFADSRTNLTWVNDELYIRTGKNGAVPSEVNSSLDNYEALRSFRYFPEPRNKYCYELQLGSNNISFLIRTMFLHGNSPELDLPVTFDVSINGTRWVTVRYARGDDLMIPQVREGIFYIPPGGINSLNTTNLCLIPKHGVPFISSLELRQFDSEGIMYSELFNEHTRQGLYFSTLIRWNPGAAASAPTVRYPDDAYDRFWIHRDAPGFLGVDSILNHSAMDTKALPSQNVSTSSKVNNVPYQVMIDAWTLCDNYPYYIHFPLLFTEPGDLVYGIFYFNILNSSILNDSSQEISLTIDGTEYPSFDITNQTTMKTFFRVLNANYSAVTVNNPYLTINALEFYKQESFASASTNPSNVQIVDFFKERLNKTDWQGDPCTPVSDDWFTCFLNFYDGTWYLDSIQLSHMDLSNGSTLPKLWEKEVSQLKNNYIPLSLLSITDSMIDDNTFQFLLAHVTIAPALHFLDLSNNSISSISNSTLWATYYNGLAYTFDSIHHMNLSHNHLREVPHLIDFPFSNQLQTLNLSSNNIRGNFPSSSYFSNLSALQTLDISNNYISGPIPDSLDFSNLPSLEVLDISNNSFTGEFPISFFLSAREAAGSFRTINVEHNAIIGVLNLTKWYQKLQSASLNHTSLNNSRFDQIFSFVGNGISDIIPTANDFQPIIDLLMKVQHFNQSGILLGGNPYCREPKQFTQRYLCRSSVNDVVHENREKNKNKILIIGIVLGLLGGSFLLCCFGVCFLIILRLWKKVSSLQEIYQELANRRVQPPYYSYNDLRLATKNFHHINNLGKGAFGAVYKGVLADGTTIAVKRLFNSQKQQVLDDFLNEVVLITGIKHKNLVQLKGCCVENGERILVYEYAEQGNVAEALWSKDAREQLNWKNRHKICIGIARGLSYLHEELQPRIIHRDIKPANILLDKNLNSKISDFGLAKPVHEECTRAQFTQFGGTRGYLAPEYVNELHLSTKVDVFSFGILMLEIISGRKCLDQSLPTNQIYLKRWAEKLEELGLLMELLQPALKKECSETDALKAIKIALMCIQSDPDLRPTMSQVTNMLLGNKEYTFNSSKRKFTTKQE